MLELFKMVNDENLFLIKMRPIAMEEFSPKK